MNRTDVIHPADAAQYFKEKYPDLFTEAYVVEATIEIVVAKNSFRLEAYRQVSGSQNTSYDVNAYKREDDTWQFFQVASCYRTTATEALMQAMLFLSEAFREK